MNMMLEAGGDTKSNVAAGEGEVMGYLHSF